MKTSLNSKALFLSLSVVLLVGSGCDRRGRAPVKPSTAGPSTTVTKTNPGAPTPGTNTTGTTPTGTTPTGTTTKTDPAPKKIIISDKEADLIVDAQMSCLVPEIDDKASVTKNTADAFRADLQLINDFNICMIKAGLLLHCSDELGKPCPPSAVGKVRNWTLEASADPGNTTAAFVEFAKLSKATDDDAAYKVMASRLELAIIRFGKLGSKYTADNLRGADIEDTDQFLDNAQHPITISSALADVAKGLKALEDSREVIKAMATVDADGNDLTKKPSEELKTEMDVQN